MVYNRGFVSLTAPSMLHQPEDSPLGKPVAYRDRYAPDLLFPIPRLAKRQEIGVDGALPFAGVDVWNAYEVSWLNLKGKPQVALATCRVPCESPCLIESKSFKLYLNSFNQECFGDAQAVQAALLRDLGAACGAPVAVDLVLPPAFGAQRIVEMDGECIDDLDVEITDYEPNPAFLEAGGAIVEETLRSDLLKSNCLVTGQPDWASVLVRYRGPRIDRAGLLKYLVSFRRHNEFHEQCVERVFVDVLRACRPTRLTVFARYTRRGGLDINPFRTNCGEAPPSEGRTARQ